jgi:DNA (cytosine-5)-methyltransferase 1
MAKKQYTFIDLFAGAGGLSEGFVRAGFTPIAHIEMDKYACSTLKTRACYHYLKNNDSLSIYESYLRNKKEKEDGCKLWNQVPIDVTDTVIQAAIGEDTINPLFEKVDKLRDGKEVDLIIGGPPCQAYSIAGRARKGKDMENDPRNELYKFYIMFLEKYKPKMFVFENVLGIISAKRGEPFKDLKESIKEAGYKMDLKVLKASEYGVLQDRQRVIIVGWREELTHLHYPHLEVVNDNYQVLKDLFSDLPTRKAGEGSLTGIVEYTKDIAEMDYLAKSKIRGEMNFTTQHLVRPLNDNDRHIYLLALECFIKEGKRLQYRNIPKEYQKHKNTERFQNRFQVVNPNGNSHTVVAHIAMDGHYYIYPNLRPTLENVRSISIREAARLQSFPDDFYFEGSRSAALKQIGNAVPVVLAETIAKGVLNIIEY